jgi:hypothetical protein
MNRCHLKGSIGDSLHAVLCAAGFNIRWLLRMIAKKGIGLFLRLLQASGLGHIGHQLREFLIYKSATPGAMRLALPSSTANPDFSRFRLSGLNKIKHLQLMF